MSTPKLVNFPHFLASRSLRQKHVNTKTSQFSTIFGFQEFEKNMSTPKLVNFHHFFDSRSLRPSKTSIFPIFCQHQNMSSQFSPFGSKFQSVNTKTSQFSPFFGFQEFEKNMSTPKLDNFDNFFGFQELRKKHQS